MPCHCSSSSSSELDLTRFVPKEAPRNRGLRHVWMEGSCDRMLEYCGSRIDLPMLRFAPTTQNSTNSPMRTRFLLGLALLLGLSVSACDTSADSNTANLTVRMTDAPFPFELASEANVTITRIELVASEDTSSTEDASSEGGRMVLFDGEPFDLNLLDLRDGVDTTLVKDLSIPADGSYRQLRFFVGDDASVVFTDGREFDLKLPSAQQSGVKVMLPEFEAEGDNVDVLIDFNVEKSFVVRGNVNSDNFNGFLFKPVLEVESFTVAPDTTQTTG